MDKLDRVVVTVLTEEGVLCSISLTDALEKMDTIGDDRLGEFLVIHHKYLDYAWIFPIKRIQKIELYGYTVKEIPIPKG
jgi:hypothetical protein